MRPAPGAGRASESNSLDERSGLKNTWDAAKPRSVWTGASDLAAEAEGFEPSMGFKAQTALAVRRHRPD